MKRLLLLIPAVLAILGAAWLNGAWRDRGDAFEARLERARLKREFVERSAAAFALPTDPPAAWRTESLALFRWYLDAATAIRNRHPGEPPRPSALESAEGEKKKPLADKDKAMLGEFQKYADDRFALLKGARYAPVASAVAGGLRLDLLTIATGPAPEGGPGLRIDFALWGAPRILEREQGNERATTKTVSLVALRKLAFKFIDEKGAPWGEMSGGGEPYLKLVDGERFVEDFPPGVLFGTWWVELFPRPPTTVQLELEVSVRGAAGVERTGAFSFTMPIDEAWRVPVGAAYQAETRIAPAKP